MTDPTEQALRIAGEHGGLHFGECDAPVDPCKGCDDRVRALAQAIDQHVREREEAARREGKDQAYAAWRREAEDWERGVNEFGHPVAPDHAHHEVRDWLNDAFSAGSTEARREGFREGAEAAAQEACQWCRAIRDKEGFTEGQSVEPVNANGDHMLVYSPGSRSLVRCGGNRLRALPLPEKASEEPKR